MKRYAGFAGLVLALVILSTSVFASGVLQNTAQNGITIETRYYGRTLAYTNQPFFKDGTVYLPLRETLGAIGIGDDNIMWGANLQENANKIAVFIPASFPYHDDNENEIEYAYSLTTGSPLITVSGPTEQYNAQISLSKGCPMLVGSTAYVPCQFFYEVSLASEKRLTDYGFKVSVYDQSGNLLEEITPMVTNDFTPDEIASARTVVEEYFRAKTQKDSEAALATLTTRNHVPAAQLFGSEQISLKNVRYDSTRYARTAYIENGAGQESGTSLENVIVFYVDYQVSFPEGVHTTAYNEGLYTDWSVILVRDDPSSPWLIDDQGY